MPQTLTVTFETAPDPAFRAVARRLDLIDLGEVGRVPYLEIAMARIALRAGRPLLLADEILPPPVLDLTRFARPPVRDLHLYWTRGQIEDFVREELARPSAS